MADIAPDIPFIIGHRQNYAGFRSDAAAALRRFCGNDGHSDAEIQN
jgi:hypothetical protein